VIVVSRRAKDFMIEKEKIEAGKILHINLAYDFNLYMKPDPERAKLIRSGYENQVTLLTVGRFSQSKRTTVVIELLKMLRDRGVPARAILLGKGEEEDNVNNMIADAGLSGAVLMPGYVHNVLDYMTASDFLVHPSVSESSCVAVKEAALTHLPVIVCKGVGDFDEYMVNEENGFIVDAGQFAKSAAAIITQYRNRDMSPITNSLHKKVIELFSVANVVSQYQKLNEA
jgi:glycosyltransferase involved in cell wall biosynthesis